MLLLLSAALVSGCQSLNNAGRAVSVYSGDFRTLSEGFLINPINATEYRSDFGPTINYYLFGSNEVSDGNLSSNTLNSAWERSQYCLRFYGRQSGIYIAYDAAGSIVSGTGSTAILASGGAAASSTNAILAGITLGPAVLRDVANLDPQQANAFQALRAVSLAQCETLALRAARLEQTDSFAARRRDLARARQAALETRGRIAAEFEREARIQRPELSGAEAQTPRSDMSEVAVRDRLRELDRQLALSIADSDRVLRVMDRIFQTTSPDRLALRLQTELQAINLVWGEMAASLAPTPEQTFRHLLAAPLTLASRLVSGESDKEVIPPQVAAVRFDYSRTRIPLNLTIDTVPQREYIDMMRAADDSPAARLMYTAAGHFNDLNEHTTNSVSAAEWIAQAPQQCRFYSSTNTAGGA
ncbi:hypothetical protein L2D01_09260 [Hyphomonadaceae bacterium ML37]|nr:hypothetical protein L2D01_09260 [Hyphomonadaceae bacterium ML37]